MTSLAKHMRDVIGLKISIVKREEIASSRYSCSLYQRQALCWSLFWWRCYPSINKSTFLFRGTIFHATSRRKNPTDPCIIIICLNKTEFFEISLQHYRVLWNKIRSKQNASELQPYSYNLTSSTLTKFVGAEVGSTDIKKTSLH